MPRVGRGTRAGRRVIRFGGSLLEQGTRMLACPDVLGPRAHLQALHGAPDAALPAAAASATRVPVAMTTNSSPRSGPGRPRSKGHALDPGGDRAEGPDPPAEWPKRSFDVLEAIDVDHQNRCLALRCAVHEPPRREEPVIQVLAVEHMRPERRARRIRRAVGGASPRPRRSRAKRTRTCGPSCSRSPP